MNVLILSNAIYSLQNSSNPHYQCPDDIHVDFGDFASVHEFTFSVFDYDISIIHIVEPRWSTLNLYDSLPKLLDDSKRALEHGRSIICLPESNDFITESNRNRGMSAYEWLKILGVGLNYNKGINIKPSGAGRAKVIQEYLECAPTYFQIVTKPDSTPQNRLAVVEDTEIIVGLEHQVEKGTIVILPPPKLKSDNYLEVMTKLTNVAIRYYDRSQRRIPIGDTPEWLDTYVVSRAKELSEQISILTNEKEMYDNMQYVLYGTGDQLESSVELLLTKLGLDVEKQPSGANIDLKARNLELDIGFAVEVTGTKGIIHKDNNKVAQAFQYLMDRVGTDEKNDKLIIVANTQYHLDPKERRQESYTKDFLDLLGNNGILMINTLQLYNIWREVHEGRRSADDVIQELYSSSGRFGS